MRWQEIQKKFKNKWVAMDRWKEDLHGDVVSGNVIHHAGNRKRFYSFVNKMYSNSDLAIRFTGNIGGPFLFDK